MIQKGLAAFTEFTPSGNLVADNVQAALVELDTEKASIAAVFGTPRTIQKFTTGSGTYTTPAGCVAIKVRMVGGGGGSGGLVLTEEV